MTVETASHSCIRFFGVNISVFPINDKEWQQVKKNCSNYQLFKSYAMREAKVVFCRERNKYAKIQNFFFWGGGLISVYFILEIKNGIVRIVASSKKLKLFKLPVIEVVYNYAKPFQLSHMLHNLYHFN